MTLDEAINNFTEAAKNHRYEQQYWLNERYERDETSPLYEADYFSLADDSRESAEYYEQLAEWLTELKELRSLKTDYVFFKAEAKRLLKAAVEDFSNMYDHIFDCDGMCETCPLHGERDNCLKWQYADEALKLISD